MAVRVIKRGTPTNVILEEKQVPAKKIKVRVIDRWRVVHPDDGTAHVKGDELTVPEATAQEWERSGYVERVTGKSAATAKREFSRIMN